MKPAYSHIKNIDEAFKKLFDNYWNGVYQLCVRYCKEESVAKDLTQNIFLSIWERKVTFEDIKSAEQYLSRSAKYQVLNYLRNQKDNIPTNENSGNHNFTETYRYNPESVYINNELSKKIDSEVNTLPEPAKTIFLLSRQQTLTYTQIASQMGISIKTVEKHMTRALRNLRAVISD